MKGTALLDQLEDVYKAQEELNSKEQRVAKIDNDIRNLTKIAER